MKRTFFLYCVRRLKSSRRKFVLDTFFPSPEKLRKPVSNDRRKRNKSRDSSKPKQPMKLVVFAQLVNFFLFSPLRLVKRKKLVKKEKPLKQKYCFDYSFHSFVKKLRIFQSIIKLTDRICSKKFYRKDF